MDSSVTVRGQRSQRVVEMDEHRRPGNEGPHRVVAYRS
jgi:hypothetical protein